MNIPSWLAGITGANAFAQNPANGYQPTIGDALQGIGHSMMEHYRAGPSGTSAGQPAAQPGALVPPNPQPLQMPQVATPPIVPAAPLTPAKFNTTLPPTLGQIATLWK